MATELEKFMQHAGERFARQFAEAMETGDEVQVVAVIRTKHATTPDHWQHVRNFDGEAALEDFYDAARASVVLWPITPDHIRHEPVLIVVDDEPEERA